MGQFTYGVSVATKASRNGTLPRNKTLRTSYNRALGELLAKDKLYELKAAQYGRLGTYDRLSSFVKLPSREGYKDQRRDLVCRKALQLFSDNEIVRAAVNLIPGAIFPNGAPDVRGKSKNLVKLAQDLIGFNGLNFIELGREGELCGDSFLWFRPNGDQTEIRSLDASQVTSNLANGDIRRVESFTLSLGSTKDQIIDSKFVQQVRHNATSTMQYGLSSLRHVFYWIDVLDSLFEKNWLRGAQYFGFPFLAITGVPGPYQESVRTNLEAQTQRAGRTVVLPPDSDVKAPDLSLDFPIGDIVGWVFRIIAIALEIPITLFGSADVASRGSAFFANPRLVMAIKPKRETWRIGLRQFFIKIFQSIGELDSGKSLSSKDFDLGFPPVFDRDFTDLADIIAILRDRHLVSKQSAREMVGLDHSDEEDRMSVEPRDEPAASPIDDPAAQAKRLAKAQARQQAQGN